MSAERRTVGVNLWMFARISGFKGEPGQAVLRELPTLGLRAAVPI